jgi:hypothetical protein
VLHECLLYAKLFLVFAVALFACVHDRLPCLFKKPPASAQHSLSACQSLHHPRYLLVWQQISTLLTCKHVLHESLLYAKMFLVFAVALFACVHDRFPCLFKKPPATAQHSPSACQTLHHPRYLLVCQ